MGLAGQVEQLKRENAGLAAEVADLRAKNAELAAKLGALETELEKLRREMGRNSSNSGKPPSSGTLTGRAKQARSASAVPSGGDWLGKKRRSSSKSACAVARASNRALRARRSPRSTAPTDGRALAPQVPALRGEPGGGGACRHRGAPARRRPIPFRRADCSQPRMPNV